MGPFAHTDKEKINLHQLILKNFLEKAIITGIILRKIKMNSKIKTPHFFCKPRILKKETKNKLLYINKYLRHYRYYFAEQFHYS